MKDNTVATSSFREERVALNGDGVLPPGIHEMTVDEIGSLFGRFQNSDCRHNLFVKLTQLANEVRAHDFIVTVIVDGSFVTAKDKPGDIDLIFCVKNSALERLDAGELKPFEYSMVSNRRLKRIYGFDVLVAPEGSDTYEHYLSYFSRDKERGGGATKGLVRLRLE